MAGEQLDQNGLIYLRARYYDPEIGRFITKDPFGGLATLAGTLNPYPYALNNPVNSTDPSGEFLDTIVDFGFIAYDLYRIGADNIFGNEDNLNENLVALVADVGGALVPFCTGAGMVVRGTRAIKGVDRALGITQKAGKAGHGFDNEQRALIELAQEAKAKKSNPISWEEGETLVKWGDEYGTRSHGPEIHPNRNYKGAHVHVGPVRHVPVREHNIPR